MSAKVLTESNKACAHLLFCNHLGKNLRVWAICLLLVLSNRGVVLTQTAFWQSLNGPFQGPSDHVALTRDGALYASNWSNGLYKSIDDGKTWQQLPLLRDANAYVTGLACDSVGNIVAATAYYPSQNIIYRSTDGGNQWSNIWQRQSCCGIFFLFINRTGTLFTDTDTGLIRSADNGNTWIPSLHQPVGLIQPTSDDAGTVYIPIEMSGPTLTTMMYRSSDDGITWETTEGIGFSARYLAARSHTLLFAGGTSGVVVSTNQGDHWIPTQYPGGPVTAMMIDSIGGLYAASAESLFFSSDSGKSWASRGVVVFGITTLLQDHGGNLIAGGGASVSKSTDEGMTWYQVGTRRAEVNALGVFPNHNIITGSCSSPDDGAHWKLGRNGGSFFNLDTSTGKIYTGGGRVSVSNDSGRTWNSLGLEQSIPSCFAIGHRGELFVGTTYDGLFRSGDSGRTWISTPMQDYYINGIALDSKGNLYVCTDYNVYKSADTAKTWIVTNLAQYRMTTVAVDPEDNVYVGRTGGIYCSTDLGDTWTFKGLPYVYVNTIVVDKSGGVIAGTDGGVYESTDKGETWIARNDGLKISDIGDPVGVESIALSPDNYLYVGTGDGVYRSSGPITGLRTGRKDLPNLFYLSQNYPNPTNPTTKILYSVPRQGFVSLKVYDILGTPVATLVEEMKSPGTYTVQFDGNRLSSGAYFYKLQAGYSSTTKKMILIK